MADWDLSVASRMVDVPRDEWDALVAATGTPLLSWGFLALLEESGSIRPETGWTPVHLLLRDRTNGRLKAAAPFYARADSWGEFVFDMELARIAERAGLRWYPKLVGMVPATPAPAWRVLTAPGGDKTELTALMLDAAADIARRSGMAGVHILWPETETAARLSGTGWASWDHQVFLWTDEGYEDFPGWLASFSKNMRRNVLRERASLAAAGVESRILTAREVAERPGLLELMADLYESHNDRFGPWAAKFLTRDFFLRLPEFLPDGWACSVGERGGATLAMAFFLQGRDRLYGRYYGAVEEIPNLHFELCYYRPIEYALERGISTFDPGMGSPHKARRGFRSGMAPSFHRVFNRRLSSFLAAVLPDINRAEADEAAALNEDLPYKAVPERGSVGPGPIREKHPPVKAEDEPTLSR